MIDTESQFKPEKQKEVSTEIQATFRKYIKGTKENKEEREKY